jgi:hypothetical protein
VKTDTPTRREFARAVSEEAKNRPTGDHREDPRQPRSGIDSREAGVGKPDAGRGSESGGDVDPDIVGVGEGRGLSQGGPDDAAAIGQAESDGSSAEFASGPPARGENRAAGPVTGDVVDRSGDDEYTNRQSR